MNGSSFSWCLLSASVFFRNYPPSISLIKLYSVNNRPVTLRDSVLITGIESIAMSNGTLSNPYFYSSFDNLREWANNGYLSLALFSKAESYGIWVIVSSPSNSSSLISSSFLPPNTKLGSYYMPIPIS